MVDNDSHALLTEIKENLIDRIDTLDKSIDKNFNIINKNIDQTNKALYGENGDVGLVGRIKILELQSCKNKEEHDKIFVNLKDLSTTLDEINTTVTTSPSLIKLIMTKPKETITTIVFVVVFIMVIFESMDVINITKWLGF